MARDRDRVTGCVCEGAGYCRRHGLHKTAHWVWLCQTREAYWRAWEAGRGPGQEQEQESTDRPPRIVRTVEEIDSLLVICQACEKFNGAHCTSANGGCPSSRRQCWERWLREKNCPIDKW